MRTSKKLYLAYRQHIKISLPIQQSISFYENEEYRNDLLLRLNNPKRQLSLSFERNYIINDYHKINNVHKIIFSHYTDDINLEELKQVSKIKLYFCEFIVDFNKLKHLDETKFQLWYCKNIQNINSEQIEEFGFFQDTFLRHQNDQSVYKNINYIFISGIQDNLEFDMQHFQQALKIHFSFCPSINNVSYLQNVDIVELTNCENLENVSTLKNVRILKLCKNNLIKEIININVQYLDVHLCKNLEILDGLDKLKEFNIHKNNKVNQASQVQLINCKITNMKEKYYFDSGW